MSLAVKYHPDGLKPTTLPRSRRIVVLINQGFDAEFFKRWLKGFITAWPVAFPSVLVVAPFVRKVVAKITA